MMEKPLLIYDGHCGFCKVWVDYFKRRTGDRFDYAPSQEVGPSYPQIPPEQFGLAVQLVFPDGRYLSGAEAVFALLGMDWIYRIPGVPALSEAAYKIIARNRSFFYRVTKLTFGLDVRPSEYARVEWLFLKALGVIYLIAFVSCGSQVLGLVGKNGILPANLYLQSVAQAFGAARYRLLPTLFWFGSSDRALQGVCIAGAVFTVLIVAGIFQRTALLAAWALYLSIFSAGQDFFSFQWDLLLLEAGFLAIFLGWSRGIVWLFRWLLFRLMFESGSVKLLSGDRTWRSLTALDFHFQTQPIPTPLAWYAHQPPAWFHHFAAGVTLGIEILIPFLIFAPRRLRHFAFGCLVGLQILILLTGNYAFFNLLALALCLFLLDDRDLRFSGKPKRIPRFGRATAAAVFVAIFSLSSYEMLMQFGIFPPLGNPVASFGIANNYGLFAVMTTTRPEIIVEGSNDGSRWVAYEFPYKAGDVYRRPPWVAPHQPRLDWQMWFAALGSYRENAWFINFLARLLQGSPEVLGLLARNPFPAAPPRYVRALLYTYKFTDAKTRNDTGAWWSRELLGTYVRPISLTDFSHD